MKLASRSQEKRLAAGLGAKDGVGVYRKGSGMAGEHDWEAGEFKEVEITCTEAQKEVITAESTPNSLINVISGPGTGKTTTLCNRIAYLLGTGVRPSEIIVFSLTNQSVNDVKNTLAGILGDTLASGVQITTIHSCANKLVSLNSAYWQVTRDRSSLDPKILDSLLRSLTLPDPRKERTGLIHERDSSLAAKLSSQEIRKIKLANPALYKKLLGYENPGISTLVKSDNVLYDKIVYEATKMLHMNYSSMKTCESDVAGTNVIIPASILDIKEVIVDEFQDISSVLLDFILEISRDKQLTVAGDIDQSLYTFNGATPDENIKALLPIYKQDGYTLKEIILDETFRFSKSIHKLSLNLLGTEYSLIKNTVVEEPINIIREEFSSTANEFEFVYNEIQDLIGASKGFLSPKSFAVLSNKNIILDRFKEYSDNRNSDLRVKRIFGSQKWLDTKASSIVSFLQLLANPHNDPSMLVAISFLDGIGPKMTMQIKKEAEEYGDSIYDYLMSSDKYVKKIDRNLFTRLEKLTGDVDRTDPSSIVVCLTEIANLFNFSKLLGTEGAHAQYNKILKELFENLKVLKVIHPTDVDLLSYFLSNYQEELLKESDLVTLDTGSADDFVTVSTIHGAKGLQWDIVFILSNLDFSNLASFPLNSRTNYVAVTRARQLVYLNKAATEKMLYVDTNRRDEANQSTVKVNYKKTMVDYIPELKLKALPNNLKELPKYEMPIGRTKDMELLGRLLGNMAKRNILPVPSSMLGIMTHLKKSCRKL